MVLAKKWGILIKKESESLVFTGLEIPRDYNKVREEYFMGTLHNRANAGEIAKTVLMPGDPLRAKFIAKTFFENPKLVTDVRNIYGFTGTYKV